MLAGCKVRATIKKVLLALECYRLSFWNLAAAAEVLFVCVVSAEESTCQHCGLTCVIQIPMTSETLAFQNVPVGVCPKGGYWGQVNSVV